MSFEFSCNSIDENPNILNNSKSQISVSIDLDDTNGQKDILDTTNRKMLMDELVDGLKVYKKYDYAINYAKEKKLPVLIYFNSEMSVNCRRFESDILTNHEILTYLNEDIIVINLYVDDPTENSIKIDSKKFNTNGEYHYYIQKEKFGTDFQPYLVGISKKGKKIEDFKYDDNVDDVLKFLKKIK